MFFHLREKSDVTGSDIIFKKLTPFNAFDHVAQYT
jgi:hypothetical protein